MISPDSTGTEMRTKIVYSKRPRAQMPKQMSVSRIVGVYSTTSPNGVGTKAGMIRPIPFSTQMPTIESTHATFSHLRPREAGSTRRTVATTFMVTAGQIEASGVTATANLSSLTQDDRVPDLSGTGTAAQRGAGPGDDTTVNCPFPAGATGTDIIGAFRAKLVPAMRHARCLLQFNEYHKYTVDEHSFRAVEAATEFLHPLLAPLQVVVLLPGGLFHPFPHLAQPGRQGLSLVEGLGRHLAGVVDAHEPDGFLPLGVGEFRVRGLGGGIGAIGHQGPAGHGAYRLVQADDQVIQRAVVSSGHGCHLTARGSG